MKAMKPTLIVFLVTNVNLNAVKNSPHKPILDATDIAPSNHRKFLGIPKLQYVDKTLFIRDALTLFINHTSLSMIPPILITRPRGFGKTVALSSLYYFCDHSFKNATALFSGLNITSKYAETEFVIEAYMSKFPVIWIDFGSVKYKTFEENTKEIKRIISDIFRGYQYVLESKQLSPPARNLFQKLIEGSEGSASVQSAIPFLGECIRDYHENVPIVLIDNYDVPFHTGYRYNYYKEMGEYMSNFYHHTIQQNSFAHRVFLTGVIQIHDSTFNINMHVFTLLDEKFSQYFGFTEEEVKHMVKWSESKIQLETLESQCGGYSFGISSVFNPLAVESEIFLRRSHKWSEVEPNEPGKTIVEHGFYPIFTMLSLVNGTSIRMDPEAYVHLPDLENRELTFWSYMLHSGYVTATRVSGIWGSDIALKIPNNKVREKIENSIKETDKTFFADYKNFTEELMRGDYEDSKYFFQKYVQSAGKYFWAKNDKEFMDTILWYVQLMLRGVEKHFNTTAEVTRYEYGFGVEVQSNRAGTAPVKVVLAQFEPKEALKHVHREPGSGKTAKQINLVFDGKDVYIVAEAKFLTCHNVIERKQL